jgi:hypothetical protein
MVHHAEETRRMTGHNTIPWYGFAGLLCLGVSQFLMYRGVEPFHSWFYSFAWWSYILMADAAVFRLKGSSLIRGHRDLFLILLPWSVTWWLIFELFNLVLVNWRYENLPPDTVLRWPGYALAYATVLPGILETRDLLGALIPDRGKRPARPVRGDSWTKPCFVLGLVLTAAVLIFPLYAFPLVWVGPTLMIEPAAYRSGGRSLVRAWNSGGGRTLWILAVAGMVCGFLWEFWNYWAGAKWIYTVPFVGHWKIFEMPVLGYFGFAAFALECYAAVGLVEAMHGLADPGRIRTRPGKALLGSLRTGFLMIPFWVLGFYLIDTFTVIYFAIP